MCRFVSSLCELVLLTKSSTGKAFTTLFILRHQFHTGQRCLGDFEIKRRIAYDHLQQLNALEKKPAKDDDQDPTHPLLDGQLYESPQHNMVLFGDETSPEIVVERKPTPHEDQAFAKKGRADFSHPKLFTPDKVDNEHFDVSLFVPADAAGKRTKRTAKV